MVVEVDGGVVIEDSLCGQSTALMSPWKGSSPSNGSGHMSKDKCTRENCNVLSYSPKTLLIKTELDFTFAGGQRGRHGGSYMVFFFSNETNRSMPSAIHYCKCQNDQSIRASDHLSAFTKDLRNHVCCSFPLLLFAGKHMKNVFSSTG